MDGWGGGTWSAADAARATGAARAAAYAARGSAATQRPIPRVRKLACGREKIYGKGSNIGWQFRWSS